MVPAVAILKKENVRQCLWKYDEFLVMRFDTLSYVKMVFVFPVF